MRFVTDRCVVCGNPARPTNLSTGYQLIDHTGKHSGTDFWFCSEEHYEKALSEYIPKEYGFEQNGLQDDEVKRFGENLNEAETQENIDFWEQRFTKELHQWHALKRAANSQAQSELRKRLQAEARKQREEQAEKERQEQEKLSQKQRIEQEKIDEKQRKLREQEELLRHQEEVRLEMLKPKPIPEKIRLEHTHVLGPSGSGKTTLIQNSLLNDFRAEQDGADDAAYIIIDPKGLLIERLSRLRIFAGEFWDRIVIVDPFDAPALNLFQKTGRNPAQLISDFRYIFSTTNQKMTGKQSPCFSFCAQLLFTIPHANLFTLIELLNDRTNKKPPSPIFQEAITKLPPVAKLFFESDFYAANYASTREEIKARIWGVLENETLSKMFNASMRTLDMDKCIRERKIVLVNTRMTQLKEAHQTFGRYIIALTKDAILARKETHPVYLVIDEFQEFADPQKTPEMLRLIREYNGGAILAHQNMYCMELDDDTRNAISTNTSIKYASSPESQDLNYMARDLRCEADFLKAQHKSDTHARFACFVRGMHPPLQHPFIVESQFGWIDKWPKMSDAQYEQLRARNNFWLEDDETQTALEKRAESAILPSEKKGEAEADKPIVPPKNTDPSKPGPWRRK